MKKMKLQMLGLSVNDLLSREQMKKVMGGSGSGGSGDNTGCSMTYQDSSGGWHTEQGSCTVETYNGPGGTTFFVPYCYTSSFTEPVNLSSNGGVSRCGSPWGL